jgi:hypothetical protein
MAQMLRPDAAQVNFLFLEKPYKKIENQTS